MLYCLYIKGKTTSPCEIFVMSSWILHRQCFLCFSVFPLLTSHFPKCPQTLHAFLIWTAMLFSLRLAFAVFVATLWLMAGHNGCWYGWVCAVLGHGTLSLPPGLVPPGSSRGPPKRMQPPAIPISQPIRSPKFGVVQSPSTSHVHARHDFLVWFEICELGKVIFCFCCLAYA